MTPIRMFAVASVVMLAGCAGQEGDTARFESWGEALAAVPVSASDNGLRGPMGDRTRDGMRVELVHPDVLWDARAVGFETALRDHAQTAMEDVAVQVARDTVADATALAPAIVREAVRPSGVSVQLGAFSSQAAAEAAWSRLESHGGLAAAQPIYETVERDGRTLTRLRAWPVAAEVVSDVCHAAGAGDWCASTARS